MLSKARAFFLERNILEVDCPILSPASSVDLHIDVMSLQHQGQSFYLHTSPEYRMKRLLADGLGDIYQLGHVFRSEEKGKWHNPEFTMVEWYRLHQDYFFFIEETISFISLFLPSIPVRYLTYREAFLATVDVDPFLSSIEGLLNALRAKNIHPYSTTDISKTEVCQYILGTLIEPHLGKNEITIIYDYPEEEASLAQIYQKEDQRVAKRFEIYYEGIELANGYHELQDKEELLRRLETNNALRLACGKRVLPIDDKFINAIEKGLPDCCGVAVGFDRLLALQYKLDSIAPILPFTWDEI